MNLTKLVHGALSDVKTNAIVFFNTEEGSTNFIEQFLMVCPEAKVEGTPGRRATIAVLPSGSTLFAPYPFEKSEDVHRLAGIAASLIIVPKKADHVSWEDYQFNVDYMRTRLRTFSSDLLLFGWQVYDK